MRIPNVFNKALSLSAPPPGSINVRRGKPVVGENGNWTPCAVLANGNFYASLFKPGHGNHQICALDIPYRLDRDALRHAIQLAKIASGSKEAL